MIGLGTTTCSLETKMGLSWEQVGTKLGLSWEEVEKLFVTLQLPTSVSDLKNYYKRVLMQNDINKSGIVMVK